ncbi:hypothetical protein B0H15DRAFT_951666 [Mycena belliarum]|uniref:Uncharacterized protein n=1 Tax=Mycena belliarum TaxID=1033014 RepID=A0AAD6TYW6_9AGAR|nr:hypothetical protein B0H15DRAFT_951666 [Mycena belliae]
MATSQVMDDMDWDYVTGVRDAIKTANPPFQRSQWGWLYPDGNSVNHRLWVRVATEAWIDGGRGGRASTDDVAVSTYFVQRFPFDEPRDLDYGFYVCAADQRVTGPDVHPVNNLINALVPDLVAPWRGNVLVLKRGLSGTEKWHAMTRCG